MVLIAKANQTKIEPQFLIPLYIPFEFLRKEEAGVFV